MSGASPSKEKFCSIIGEIVDKTCDIIVDTEEALEYDAVELTVLLKSIGFRLISFEFETSPEVDSSDIEMEIRCKRSGITSKLLLNAKKCTCPERNKQAENNNSYWEIQGRGPQTPVSRFKGIVKDTSCDLLPDISRKSANISRTTLAMLLQNYQNDFSPDKSKGNKIDVKTFADYLNIKMPNNGELSSASRTTSLPSIVESDAQMQKSQSANNLTTANSNPHSDANAATSGEPESCENGKISDSDKNADESLTFSTLSSLKSDSIDLDELNFEFDYEPNEKDRNLVQKILKARKNLDVALKLIKSKPSSININQLSDIKITEIVLTPPNPKVPSRSTIKTRRTFPAMQTGRRSSIGSSTESPAKFSPQTPKTLPKNRIIKRESFKSSEKTNTPSKSTTPLRRTSSGTNLRPNTNNLTKGHVTKSNATKFNMSKKL
ncbi:unnamed protein product [Hermetia illucens]|uniref:Uncharacterized protein n=1 Tax=Hermetia illucens TaxID=343691 RepID=A0A7R8UVQ1_HERIL|nr:uncharacterized protein LOC119653382 [Hermetia illucens]CAD7087997.1 unnamed protein product [Hermetia illucens]